MKVGDTVTATTQGELPVGTVIYANDSGYSKYLFKVPPVPPKYGSIDLEWFVTGFAGFSGPYRLGLGVTYVVKYLPDAEKVAPCLGKKVGDHILVHKSEELPVGTVTLGVTSMPQKHYYYKTVNGWVWTPYQGWIIVENQKLMSRSSITH